MVKIRLVEAMDLKQIRDNRRLSIADVSRGTGLSRQTISRMVNQPELERIDVDTVNTLCDYFGCGFYDLIEVIEQERAS